MLPPAPLPLEERLRAFFALRSEGIAAVYLFGSESRGRASSRSDVDVGVLFRAEPQRSYQGLPLDLEGELERYLGRSVDLVALNLAPVDLVHRVLRDGRIIVDNDPEHRVLFEVQARGQYLDLLPVLERYRRMQA